MSPSVYDTGAHENQFNPGNLVTIVSWPVFEKKLAKLGDGLTKAELLLLETKQKQNKTKTR